MNDDKHVMSVNRHFWAIILLIIIYLLLLLLLYGARSQKLGTYIRRSGVDMIYNEAT